MTTTFLVAVLVTHYIADFWLQRDSWARAKSSAVLPLVKHIAVYSTCLCVFLPWVSWWFPLVNGAAHFVTDYITSRWMKRLYEANRRRDFFLVLGLDQFLHYAVLVITL